MKVKSHTFMGWLKPEGERILISEIKKDTDLKDFVC